MNNLLRAIVVLAGCAVLLAVWITFSAGVVEMQLATTAAETARYVAAQETQRVQTQEWNATLRSAGDNAAFVFAWSAAAAALVVAAVQAGRTLRHRESERTRRRALLAWYMAHCLPPGARAEIVTHRGDLAVANHDAAEIVPYSVAALEVRR